ncbi:MAG TPA: LysM peptidoglycan-binding domain-containing protein [Herpetosiphonaceae bacterium]|nr:LysM peptidoglycan-binding domain-containing protein [Herpetosiphonaceae bacterium]
MANNEKPRNKGLGEYAKDFAEGLLGRDNDDNNDAAARQRDDEPGNEKPRDKGIAEYTKDFVGGLFGRNDDDNDNDQPKVRQEANASNEHLPGRMTDAIEQAKERASQAQSGQANQGGVIGSVNNAVEEARKRAEEAQNAAKPKPQSAGSKPNNPFSAQQQSAKPQAAPAGPPKPAAPDNSAQEAELQRLRDRVSELERQHSAEAAPPPAPAPQQRTYTVQPGDSMRRIAERFYGDEMKWKRIYEANRDKIKNPDLIHPGQEFIIPD